MTNNDEPLLTQAAQKIEHTQELHEDEQVSRDEMLDELDEALDLLDSFTSQEMRQMIAEQSEDKDSSTTNQNEESD
jgi:hypothetical protein